MSKAACYIGTSGWSYKHWKGEFYPEDLKKNDWLAYYSDHFDTVEVNASFYHEIKAETYEGWREQVAGKNFRFSIKITRYLTHVKKLNECAEIWNTFIQNVNRLGDTLGPILVQIPGNLKANPDKLKALLQAIPDQYSIAFEPRNETWLSDDIYAIMEEHNCALVISDTPEWPTEERLTANFGYIRLHGPDGLYSSRYSSEQLQEWADKINRWHEQLDHVYVYFNNDAYGHAIANALELKELVC